MPVQIVNSHKRARRGREQQKKKKQGRDEQGEKEIKESVAEQGTAEEERAECTKDHANGLPLKRGKRVNKGGE